MKRKKIIKLVAAILCVCVALCGSTVYALKENSKAERHEKLTKIAEYEKKFEQVQKEIRETDDEVSQQRLKKEFEEVSEKKRKLQIETNTYPYDEELETSIYSVEAALKDNEIIYERCPEKLTEKKKKRQASLKSLCANYRKQMSFCQSNNDYKELLEGFRAEIEEINMKYQAQ